MASSKDFDPSKRRIVKATKPSASDLNVSVEQTPSPVNDDDIPLSSDSLKYPTMESPSVKKQYEEENQQRLKDRLRQDASSRQAKKRLETKRRLKNGESSSTTTANPFSRFLSAFSVEPQFPEHKRKSDLDMGPEEKRLRSASDDEADVNATDDDGKNGKFGLTGTLLLSAAAVAGVAVWFALARGRGGAK